MRETKKDREALYRFLDAMLDRVEYGKKEIEKKKKKIMQYGKFVAFRLPEELFDAVEMLSEKMKKTNSEIIREAVKEYVERQKDLLKDYLEKDEEEKERETEQYLKAHKEAIREYLESHKEEILAYLEKKYESEKEK